MDTPKPSPAPGVAQTTIDSSTTTVDPATVTIQHRIEPGGTPHLDDAKTAKGGSATPASVPMHPADPKA